MRILNWLNSNSGAIGALSSAVLTVITIVYVYLTGRLAKESQAMRLSLLRPELAVYLSPHEAHLYFVLLRIENIGSGPAHQVRFSTDRPFQTVGEVDLRELGIFRKGVNFLAPTQRIEHFLVNTIGKLQELAKSPLRITAVYTDVLGEHHKQEFALDFSELEYIAQLGTPPLYEIAAATKKVQEDINRLATGSSKIQVLTEPLSDHSHRLLAQSLMWRLERLTSEQLDEIGQVIAEKEQANTSEKSLANGVEE